MIRLVDRLNGEVLGDIPADDMDVLHKALTEEDESDADYYLNPETLDLLSQAGMSQTGLDILRRSLTDRDEVDIGWEPVVPNPVTRLWGRVKAPDGQALGGLLIDLADADEEVEDALSWTFSRPDGSFEIHLDAEDLEEARHKSMLLTLSALGDDWLLEREVQLRETPLDLGEIQVPTFHGRVISEEEKRPLPGIALQVTMLADEGAVEWFGTWVTTRADGSFRFPYRPPDENVPVRQTMLLELMGPGGEPLRDIELVNPMELSPDLGELECLDPEQLEEEEDEQEAAAEEAPGQAASEGTEGEVEEETIPVDAVFPGIQQHPLE